MSDEPTVQFNAPEDSPEPIADQAPSGGSFVRHTLAPVLVIMVVVLSGIGSGWFLSQKVGGSLGGGQEIAGAPQAEQSGQVIGIDDEATFSDSATGMLEKEGIDGEGTHHLVRGGGPSQNVYLTSSVIDLNQFVGKKVEVWGETFAGQTAGWLMDVGKVKILE